MYSLQCILYTYTLYTVQCTMYTVLGKCIQYTTQYTYNSTLVQFLFTKIKTTVQNSFDTNTQHLRRTLYDVQCTLYAMLNDTSKTPAWISLNSSTKLVRQIYATSTILVWQENNSSRKLVLHKISTSTQQILHEYSQSTPQVLHKYSTSIIRVWLEYEINITGVIRNPVEDGISELRKDDSLHNTHAIFSLRLMTTIWVWKFIMHSNLTMNKFPSLI